MSPGSLGLGLGSGLGLMRLGLMLMTPHVAWVPALSQPSALELAKGAHKWQARRYSSTGEAAPPDTNRRGK